MTTIFTAPRPGAWLREDIADVLTALAMGNTDPSYLEGLRAAALALGLVEQRLSSSIIGFGGAWGDTPIFADTIRFEVLP